MVKFLFWWSNDGVLDENCPKVTFREVRGNSCNRSKVWKKFVIVSKVWSFCCNYFFSVFYLISLIISYDNIMKLPFYPPRFSRRWLDFYFGGELMTFCIKTTQKGLTCDV